MSKKKKYSMIVSLILFLSTVPHFIVKYFDYYPDGYDYYRTAEALNIYKLDSYSKITETFSKDNSISFLVHQEDDERYIDVRYYIILLQSWYERLASAGGATFAVGLLLLSPRRIIKTAFALPKEMQTELQKDAPFLYNLLRNRLTIDVVLIILFSSSLVFLITLWQDYPHEAIDKIELFINAKLR